MNNTGGGSAVDMLLDLTRSLAVKVSQNISHTFEVLPWRNPFMSDNLESNPKAQEAKDSLLKAGVPKDVLASLRMQLPQEAPQRGVIDRKWRRGRIWY